MASKKHVFTQIEKKVFLEILKSHSTIIESKNTDSSTLREKNVAWNKITREYNASPHVTGEVSSKQLRRLWTNMKQRQREAIMKERQHGKAIGVAPLTSSAVIDSDVTQIAPGLMIEIPGANDSDIVFLESEDGSLDTDYDQPELFLDVTQQSCPHTTMAKSQPEVSTISHSTTTPSPLIVTFSPPRTITSPPSRTITIRHPSNNTSPLTPCTTSPPPPHNTSPSPPHNTTPPLPMRTTAISALPTSTCSTTSFQHRKNGILQKEYRDRFKRAGEIHAMKKELLRFNLREAKAKAELAELILQRERSQSGTNE